jgi:hypothetical protein
MNGLNNEKDALDDDLQNAYDLGQEYAENGVELSSNGRDYSMVAGEIITDEKDNGCGASNAELEQFWQGYEEQEPMKQGCWTEMDISNIVDREKPTTITIGGEEEPCCASGNMLDTDMLAQIEEIIKTGRL